MPWGTSFLEEEREAEEAQEVRSKEEEADVEGADNGIRLIT